LGLVKAAWVRVVLWIVWRLADISRRVVETVPNERKILRALEAVSYMPLRLRTAV
jgi:hypothetical protein